MNAVCLKPSPTFLPYLGFLLCRRALYIVTYLLFPINVLVGVLAGVWRMVISALYNMAHFCQLDVSLLSHGAEAFDPGKCGTQAGFSLDSDEDRWEWIHYFNAIEPE